MKLAIAEPGTSRKNKTGSWRTYRPTIDKAKCIKCATCETFCPDSCILVTKPDNTKQVAEFDLDYCKGCGICAKVCPVKCITMIQEEKP